MNLETQLYNEQECRWPESGKVILAQFDEESVVVYQAYKPSIGRFAAEHGFFGGDFKYSRMTWIKPNFLWMMYRSDWGRKSGQEVTLAIRLKPYYAAPVVRDEILQTYPDVREALAMLGDVLDDATMQRLNNEVDEQKRSPEAVAREFLISNALLRAH